LLDGDPSEELRIKVGDFGLAKEFNTSTKFTNIGTEEYIAPEIRNGDKCDQNVDVYSIGVILYELIFGEVKCLMNQKSITVPSMPGISEDLRLLVERMLTLNSKDRLNYKDLSEATINYAKTVKETSASVYTNSHVQMQLHHIKQTVSAPAVIQCSNPPVLSDPPKKQ